MIAWNDGDDRPVPASRKGSPFELVTAMQELAPGVGLFLFPELNYVAIAEVRLGDDREPEARWNVVEIAGYEIGDDGIDRPYHYKAGHHGDDEAITFNIDEADLFLRMQLFGNGEANVFFEDGEVGDWIAIFSRDHLVELTKLLLEIYDITQEVIFGDVCPTFKHPGLKDTYWD